MTEMIERVAQAMKDRAARPVGNLSSLEPVLVGSLGDAWRVLAQAAIESAREPTEAMKAAGAKQVGYDAYEPGEDVEMAVDCHHAMIDAALR